MGKLAKDNLPYLSTSPSVISYSPWRCLCIKEALSTPLESTIIVSSCSYCLRYFWKNPFRLSGGILKKEVFSRPSALSSKRSSTSSKE